MQDPQTRRTIGDRDLEGLVVDVARERISRKQFLVRAAAMGLSTGAIASVLAACGSTGSGGTVAASGSPAAYASTRPDRLLPYTWQDYITGQAKSGSWRRVRPRSGEGLFFRAWDTW